MHEPVRCRLVRKNSETIEVWYDIGEDIKGLDEANTRLEKYGVQVHKSEMGDMMKIPMEVKPCEKDCVLVLLGAQKDPEWALMQQAMIVG